MNRHVFDESERTYHRLRIGMAVLGFMLPVALGVGGKLLHNIDLLPSMSAYYHKPMREVFTGILVAVGFCLFAYEGFSRRENQCINAAGLLSLGIAIFPNSGDYSNHSLFSEHVSEDTLGLIHGVCAVSFFVLIAMVCGVFGKKSLDAVPEGNLLRVRSVNVTKPAFHMLYNLIAVAMVLGPIIASAIIYMQKGTAYVFACETVGVWSFSAYWLLKTLETAYSRADIKLRKRLDVTHIAVSGESVAGVKTESKAG